MSRKEEGVPGRTIHLASNYLPKKHLDPAKGWYMGKLQKARLIEREARVGFRKKRGPQVKKETF